jgi:hypothetical protein
VLRKFPILSVLRNQGGRLTRAIRRLRETFLSVMPDAKDIDAANDSEK